MSIKVDISFENFLDNVSEESKSFKLAKAIIENETFEDDDIALIMGNLGSEKLSKIILSDPYRFDAKKLAGLLLKGVL